MVDFEIVEEDGIRFAEIIRASAVAEETHFISGPDSSFQFGLLAQRTGYEEKAHFHPELNRKILDLQELIVVQRGILALRFFTMDGQFVREVELRPGDAAVLVAGVHGYRAIEDVQAFILKQGPFFGAAIDKVYVEARQ